MKKSEWLKKLWLPLLIVLVMFAVSLFAYPQLPERVPTHWNIAGEPDGWSGPEFAAFFAPCLTLFMLALMAVIPFIDPRRENVERFAGIYSLILTTIIAFMALIHFTVLASGLGYRVPVSRVVDISLGSLFVLIGNYLTKVKPNYFIGIRTPWTLENETVWRKTHRVGGYAFVGGGLLIIAGSFLPPTWSFALMIAVTVVITVGTAVYSYRLFQKEQAKK